MECLKNLNPMLINKNFDLDYRLWKICVFSEMFFNLPFTLGDVIFIPRSYIKSSMGNNPNSINKPFSRTLIHEKIHLLQRYNQNIWDNYITSNTKWVIIDKNIYHNSTLINGNKIIYNPDTYYVKNKFAYSPDDKKYYGTMLLDSNKKIKDIWYQLVESGNKINAYPISYSITKYEHPYEELAYNMADNLAK